MKKILSIMLVLCLTVMIIPNVSNVESDQITIDIGLTGDYWNFKSYPNTTATDSPTLFNEIDNCTALVGKHNTTGYWYTYWPLIGLLENWTIYPGDGLFIQVNGDTNWQVTINATISTNGSNYTRSATYIIASNSSTQEGKDSANYVCDGINDEDDITTALDSLGEVGGKVLLLEGIYYIQSETYIDNDNVTLEGMGFSTVLSMTNHLYFSNVTNFTLKNMKLDGNNHTAITIKFLDKSENVHVEGVWSLDSADHGFHIQEVNNGMFINNIAEGGYDDGFALSGENCTNISLIGNIARNQYNGTTSSNGIEIDDGPHDITVIGNIAYGNPGGSGIDVHAHVDYVDCPVVYNVIISGNVVTDNNIHVGGTGAQYNRSERPHDIGVEGNTVRGGSIVVTRTFRVFVLNNIITDSPSIGISVGQMSDSINVIGNMIYNSGSYGINIDGDDITDVNCNYNIVDSAIDVSIRYRNGDGNQVINFIGNNIVNTPTNAFHISNGMVNIAENIISDGGRVFVDGGDQITVHANIFDGGYIYISSGASNVVVSENQVNNSGFTGIYINSDYTIVRGNIVSDLTGGGRNGILVDSDYCVIDGNFIDYTASGHGIEVTGDNTTIKNNIIDNINGANFDLSISSLYGTIKDNHFLSGKGVSIPSGFLGSVQDNIGYITKNYGNESAGTSILVAHGLAGTPDYVVLTPQGSTANCYVSLLNETYFTITSASSVAFYWYAIYKP